MLFPIAEYWWFYAAFTGFVLVLLAIDLGVFNRQAHVVCIAKRRSSARSGSRWR